MINSKKVNGKFSSMKKSKEWVVYPHTDKTKIVIQSDTRIAQVNTETGKAVLSKNVSSGAYFVHLSPIVGATEVDCPQDILNQLLS